MLCVDMPPIARPSPPDYGIMFNHDGTFHAASEYPQSVEQLLGKIYDPLRDTQVGALLWCVGADEVRWPSDKLESIFSRGEARTYESVKQFRRSESVRAMYARGDDLYGDMVRRGHDLGMHVYVAIRMNDNHFWSDAARQALPLAPEDMANIDRPGLTETRKRHPEWTLGVGNAPRWAATSWNMALSEVRELTLQRIREACALAPWDGVEIDWQRHAFHLPQFDAYRLRYTLTDLQRGIRQVTDDIARRRGRPFYVLTRVGASEETNRRVGYDVDAWIDEGLCDIVATNANSGNDPGVEVERYVERMRGANIKLYPGFDSHGEFGRDHLTRPDVWRNGWCRGLAKSYYERGASGVHLFNWHNYAQAFRPLLTTIGSPKTLSGVDTVYTAVRRHDRGRAELRYGAERDDRLLGETPVPLHRTITGDGPTFHIRIHDDPANDSTVSRVELQINVNHHSPRDSLSVFLDGEPLGEPAVRRASDGQLALSEDAWLVWRLDAKRVGRGVREARVVLRERDARLNVAPTIEHVEIHIAHANEGEPTP